MSDKLENKFSKTKCIIFDFDGVFTDNRVYTNQHGVETVACWRSDGLGLNLLKKIGFPLWVVSSEKNKVVSMRCKKLDIPCIQGCDDKSEAIKELLRKESISLDSTAFVGNDINDESSMRIVGFPIAVADAYPEIINIADYVTKRNGGMGAVREVCDLLIKHKN